MGSVVDMILDNWFLGYHYLVLSTSLTVRYGNVAGVGFEAAGK